MVRTEFDLAIFDEAHKQQVIRPRDLLNYCKMKKIRVKRKLFMTATERQFIGDTSNLLSMDDEVFME